MLSNEFGGLLRTWRQYRSMKQIDLGVAASVSTRHLSFLETGRAVPSRVMVLALSRTLRVPPHVRNRMLFSAGFAPLEDSLDLDSLDGQELIKAVERIAIHSNPFPVLAYDQDREFVLVNRTLYAALCRYLGEEKAAKTVHNESGDVCARRLVLSDEYLKPWISNWEEVAKYNIRRIHDELSMLGITDRYREKLEQLLTEPGLPVLACAERVQRENVLPTIRFKKDGREMSTFFAVTHLTSPEGAPYYEIFVETLYPSNKQSHEALRNLERYVFEKPLPELVVPPDTNRSLTIAEQEDVHRYVLTQ